LLNIFTKIDINVWSKREEKPVGGCEVVRPVVGVVTWLKEKGFLMWQQFHWKWPWYQLDW
jgi:hypothetical protein